MRQEGKSVIFKDIEMGPMAFERESFVPLLQRVLVFAQPLYSISESL